MSLLLAFFRATYRWIGPPSLWLQAQRGPHRPAFMKAMDDIVIASTWREKLQDLAARREQAWPLLLLVGALGLFAVVIAGGDAPAQVAPPAAASAPSAASPAPMRGPVLVHVAGAVRQPDLYEFPEGARVADAIETAGGPLAKADLDALNLAEPLVDGAQVLVPKKGDPATTPASGPAATEATAIRLNSADQTQLETIPGIGPVTATAILEERDRIGGFDSIDQLLDVDGIGPATLEDIRSYVTL